MSWKEKEKESFKMAEPKKETALKEKLIAKKGIRISSPGYRLVIKEGDDCSGFAESIKKRLKNQGVI